MPSTTEPGDEADAPRRVRLVLILGALSGFGALTIDMYLPALPGMAADLRTSAATVQLTLSAFVAGLAVGQVVVGPVSDAVGRRRPLLAGLAVYLAASLCCALAPTAGWLVGARVLQSFGAAAAAVLARAVVRDLFDGVAMTRFFSTLMLVNGAAPVVAPVIGGQLLRVASWRAVFLVLGAVGAVLLVAVAVALPESLPARRRQPARLRRQLRTFAALLADTDYLRYILAAALVFASMFAYIAGSSFVLQDLHGLSAQEYSVVFGVNGLGIVACGQLNGRLVGRVATARTLLGAGLVAAVVGGAGVLLCTGAGLPLPPLLASLFLVVAVNGVVLPNATSLALAPHGGAAGAASSLQGLVQFLVGGAAAAAMGLGGQGSAVPMGVTVCACAVAALAVFAALTPGAGTSATARRTAARCTGHADRGGDG